MLRIHVSRSAKLLIKYARGEISVLGREGLEAACCKCYSVHLEDYARLLARP